MQRRAADANHSCHYVTIGAEFEKPDAFLFQLLGRLEEDKFIHVQTRNTHIHTYIQPRVMINHLNLNFAHIWGLVSVTPTRSCCFG